MARSLAVCLTLMQIDGKLFVELDRAALVEMGVEKSLHLSRFSVMIKQAQQEQ